MILVQFAFWAFVMEEGLLLLADRGVDQRILLLSAAISSIIPSNYLQLCTIWKDIPYTIALLWLTILIARLVLCEGSDRKWTIHVQLVIDLVLIFFLRQNGIVVYCLAIVILVCVFRRSKRLLASLAVSVVLILFIRFPVYSWYDVQEAASGGMYIGLGQDILGVYYSGGDLTEESLEIVRVLTSNDMGQFSFDPYRASSSYNLDISIPKFIWNYIQTFIRNPIVMTREILLRQDYVWDVFVGEHNFSGSYNFYGIANDITINDLGEIWSTYYPARSTNSYTYSLITFQNYCVDNQLLYNLVWNSGFAVLLTMLAFLSLVFKEECRKSWLIFLPFAGQIVSLLLTTGWNDYRYYWPLNVMAMFIILLVPTIYGSSKKSMDLPGTAGYVNENS